MVAEEKIHCNALPLPQAEFDLFLAVSDTAKIPADALSSTLKSVLAVVGTVTAGGKGVFGGEV